jgi:hypothetical protein
MRGCMFGKVKQPAIEYSLAQITRPMFVPWHDVTGYNTVGPQESLSK